MLLWRDTEITIDTICYLFVYALDAIISIFNFEEEQLEDAWVIVRNAKFFAIFCLRYVLNPNVDTPDNLELELELFVAEFVAPDYHFVINGAL